MSFNMSDTNDAINRTTVEPTKEPVDPLEAQPSQPAQLRTEIQIPINQTTKSGKPTAKPTEKYVAPVQASQAQLRIEREILQKQKAREQAKGARALEIGDEIRLLKSQLALEKLDSRDTAGIKKLRAEIHLLKKRLALRESQRKREASKDPRGRTREAKLADAAAAKNAAKKATTLKSKPLSRSNHTAAKNATRAPSAKLLQKSNGKTVKGELSGTTEHSTVAAPLAVASVVAVCACVAVFAVIRRRQRDSAATAPASEGYNTLV